MTAYVLHLVRADIRRARWLIAGFLIITAALAASYGVQPITRADPANAYWGWLAFALLSWAVMILTLVIVPTIVQSDSAVGTNAFWMTRPIPPAALCGAKVVLLAFVVVLIPAVVECGLMAIYGVPVRPMARVALQTMLVQALATALLMTAAALTANLARFAVLCGAALALGAATLGISQAVTVARNASYAAQFATELSIAGDMSINVLTGPMVDHTAGIMAVLLLVAACLVLVLTQYRTRSRRRSIVAGLVGASLAVTVGAWWPWPLLRPPVTPPAWALPGAALRLTVDPQTIETGPLFDRPQESLPRRVSTSFDARTPELPEGWLASATAMESSFQIGAVHLVGLGAGGFGAPVTTPEGGGTEQAVLSRLLAVGRVLGANRPVEPLSALSLPDREVRRYAGSTGHYTGRFRIGLTRATLTASVPLRAGARAQAGPFRVVVDGVTTPPVATEGWHVAVAARESNASSILDRGPAVSRVYFLRNRATRVALRGFAPFDNGGATALSGVISPMSVPPRLFEALQDVMSSGFRARDVTIYFNTEPAPDGGLDEWLAGAELVVVCFEDGGWVERTIEIPDFPLRPSPTPPPGQPHPFGTRMGG